MIVNPVIYSGKELPELENPGTAADLLAGKQLVDQYGNPLTGTMPEVEQAVPSISVSPSGLITASAEQDAGHVIGGTKSATKQMTTQGGKTVTPGTSRQMVVSSGQYTTGDVYVAGDENLKAENIKSGKSIFGVVGSAKVVDFVKVSFAIVQEGPLQDFKAQFNEALIYGTDHWLLFPAFYIDHTMTYAGKITSEFLTSILIKIGSSGEVGIYLYYYNPYSGVFQGSGNENCGTLSSDKTTVSWANTHIGLRAAIPPTGYLHLAS